MLLMDGLAKRQNVIVIAATNLLNALDLGNSAPVASTARLRSPSPDRDGRSSRSTAGACRRRRRGAAHLANITHGFVGAPT
ncbi:MAG: hypothetical protein U0790_19210 [Isosphaeraceae bacterium]